MSNFLEEPKYCFSCPVYIQFSQAFRTRASVRLNGRERCTKLSSDFLLSSNCMPASYFFFFSCLLQPFAAGQRDSSGKSALHYCAGNANLNCISQILRADPSLLNAADEEGYTPLHLAVIAGNCEIVRFLISGGADVNAVDSEGHSTVHWATGKIS